MTDPANPDVDGQPRIATGVPGLDEILGGGLPDQRLYLIYGGSGSGKTTLGLQFLEEGARLGESVLYLSLLQSKAELHDTARSHGWSLEGITMIEMPAEVREAVEAEQTVFAPAEVEMDEVSEAIFKAIEEHQPRRLVLDSISELQLIVENPHQLRRELMKLKRALMEIGCTTLMTAGHTVVEEEPIVQTIMHGVIGLHRTAPAYGENRRQIEVEKIRGEDFAGGRHDFVIRTGGLEAFPRFTAEPAGETEPGSIPSGNTELDALFGGGLDEGSACLVMGTSGVGKSTLASLYVSSVADRGAFASVYCFDESRETFMHRCRGLKLPIADHVAEGRVDLRQYSVGALTPGQFLHDLREDVEHRGAKLVVIDSFTGYLNLMPHEQHLTNKLHEIIRFLSSRNVLTLVTVNLHSPFGTAEAGIPTSYLADSVVLMRHFEGLGSVRRCIAMLKKRHGAHERTIREVDLGEGGVRLGPPLKDFTGLLTGSPQYLGRRENLLTRESDEGER